MAFISGDSSRIHGERSDTHRAQVREGVLWTDLSRCEISPRLREMGTSASRHTVRKLLRKHRLGQRKARKKKSMGAHPDRNAPFEIIARLKANYMAAGDPVISIDTKKKELIGDFAREGHTHTSRIRNPGS